MSSLNLPVNAELKVVKEPKVLGRVVVVKGFAEATPPAEWKGKLYQPPRQGGESK